MNWKGTLSFFHHVKDNTATPANLTWAKLLERFQTPRVMQDDTERKAKCPLFSAALFTDNKRGNKNATQLCALILDYDNAPEMEKSLAAWQDVAHFAYTTWSHGSAKKGNAYRVFIPLSSPIPADKYKQLWQLAYQHTDQAIDKACKDPARIQYLPVIPADSDTAYQFIEHTAPLLDWQALCLEPFPQKKTPQNNETEQKSLKQRIESHGKRADKYIQAAVTGKFSDAIQRMTQCADGEKHNTLLEQGKLLGGLLHHGIFTQTEAADALVNAIADRCESVSDARKTAIKAIEHGTGEPIAIEPPPPKMESAPRRGGEVAQKNDTPQTQIPEIYKVTKEALWKGQIDSQGEFKFERKLSGPLHIDAITYDSKGSTEGRLLRFHTRRGWKTHIINMGVLASDGTELTKSLMDMGLKIQAPYISETKKMIAGYINESEPAKIITTTEKSGWHGETFILAGGDTIGGNDELMYNGGETDIFVTKGTLEEWQEHVGKLAIGNSRMIFSINLGFDGPVMALVDDDGAGINWEGETSTGKSTVQFAVSSVWGHPDPGKFTCKWNASQTGLELQAVQRNNTVMVIDELGEVDPKIAGKLMYQLASGVQKTRGNKDVSLRDVKTWKMPIVSSAEKSVAEQIQKSGERAFGGQLIRMVSIPSDAGKGYGIFEELHGMLEKYNGDAKIAGRELSELIKANAKKYHGTAGRAFVKAVIEFGVKDTVEFIIKTRQSFMDAIPKEASAPIARAAKLFARNAATGELACKLGITPWGKGESVKAAVRCFNDYVKENGLDNPDKAQCIAKVRYFIQANWDNFRRWHEPNVGEASHTRTISKNIGWLSEDEKLCYILPPIFKNDICIKHEYKPEFVVTTLDERQALVCDEGRKQKMLSKNNQKIKVYAIKSDFVFGEEEKGDGYCGYQGTHNNNYIDFNNIYIDNKYPVGTQSVPSNTVPTEKNSGYRVVPENRNKNKELHAVPTVPAEKTKQAQPTAWQVYKNGNPISAARSSLAIARDDAAFASNFKSWPDMMKSKGHLAYGVEIKEIYEGQEAA
jgi:uncharacterized protein (DUF927 family)